MREAVLSPSLFVTRPTERVPAVRADGRPRLPDGWNPEDFAKEQIRSLVNKVFLSTEERQVRQVVFSAADPVTDVRNLCWQVGEELALETKESIAVVGDYAGVLDADMYVNCVTQHLGKNERTPWTQKIAQERGNLRLVPPPDGEDKHVSTALLHSYLGEMRSQFQYSIIVGSCAAESNAATAMAQLADGIVLVLSAQRTRRITARRIKERLEAAQAHLLGVVLGDRVFPIPEGIYRRL